MSKKYVILYVDICRDFVMTCLFIKTMNAVTDNVRFFLMVHQLKKVLLNLTNWCSVGAVFRVVN